MNYIEFLDTVKVLRMLYGKQVAEKFFDKHVDSYYDLTSASIVSQEKVGS